ncbi:hypothetical protein ACFL35_17415 [Candidatus Riflebacteria bacterium]
MSINIDDYESYVFVGLKKDREEKGHSEVLYKGLKGSWPNNVAHALSLPAELHLHEKDTGKKVSTRVFWYSDRWSLERSK